jgi:hypothetical protein
MFDAEGRLHPLDYYKAKLHHYEAGGGVLAGRFMFKPAQRG